VTASALPFLNANTHSLFVSSTRSKLSYSLFPTMPIMRSPLFMCTSLSITASAVLQLITLSCTREPNYLFDLTHQLLDTSRTLTTELKMYRLSDPRQIPTSSSTKSPYRNNTSATAGATARPPSPKPKQAEVSADASSRAKPAESNEERRNAVSDASTAEPAENRFESFPAFEGY